MSDFHVHDDRRLDRLGMPEAVLCSAKTSTQLRDIVDHLVDARQPVLLTRLAPERLDELSASARDHVVHDPISNTATVHGRLPERPGDVVVVAAGTSDQSVAAEAAATLSFSGVVARTIGDVGVAGIWRLQERLDDILAADIVIAVAGMDAALVSVLGGLVAAPIVAVPTSVGYGVANGGSTALHSSLASCAQGVTVVNIDNGFGAACAAIRMLRLASNGGG
ncbi:MAG: nickel pincer cofactor biosynthesis protein LarB [Actinomycetota bacterium]